MTSNGMKVADDVVVSLDYVLRLDDGEVIGGSEEDEPLQFLQGRGQIPAGLESELYGMVVGQQGRFVVEAAEAFGDYDEEAVLEMPRGAFPEEMSLEPGEEIELMDDETGEEFMGYVVEAGEEVVLLDLNHPLAGEKLHFQVRIADLREATAEELTHGHVHGADHDH